MNNYHNLHPLNTDGKWGFANSKGDIIVPCQYMHVAQFPIYSRYFFPEKDISAFRDIFDKEKPFGLLNLMLVQTFYEQWGIINNAGKIVIPCYWKDIHCISDRAILVEDENGNEGLFDIKGKVICNCEWNKIYNIFENLFVITDKHNNKGLVNLKGTTICKCVWRDLYYVGNDFICIENNNHEKGIINSRGKIISNCQWLDVNYDTLGYLCVTNANGQKGLMNRNGEIILKCRWKDIHWIGNGVVFVTDITDNNKKLVNFDGQTLSIPRWDDIRWLRNGLVCVTNKKGKKGLVNSRGKSICRCQWKEIWLNYIEEKGNLICVKDYDNRCGFINKRGKVVVPCQWQSIGDFHEGRATVQSLYGRWGFVDHNGELVITCMFDYADDFSDGKATVVIGSFDYVPEDIDELFENSKDTDWIDIDYQGNPLNVDNEEFLEYFYSLEDYCSDPAAFIKCHNTIQNSFDTYERYGGTNAQDEMEYSDDDIDTIFDGSPDAYWNID